MTRESLARYSLLAQGRSGLQLRLNRHLPRQARLSSASPSTVDTTEHFVQIPCKMGRSIDQDVHAAFVEFRAKGNYRSFPYLSLTYNTVTRSNTR